MGKGPICTFTSSCKSIMRELWTHTQRLELVLVEEIRNKSVEKIQSAVYTKYKFMFTFPIKALKISFCLGVKFLSV